MNSLKSNYKPVWYVLSLIGIVFIMITVMGFTSFVSLDMVLAFGNNASNQNITGVDYIDANYFVGDGSLLTNLNVNQTTLNDTLQSVTNRGASTTNYVGIRNTNPQALLHIGGTTSTPTGLIVQGGSGGSGSTIADIQRYGGTSVFRVRGDGVIEVTNSINGLPALSISKDGDGGVLYIGNPQPGSTASPRESNLIFRGYAGYHIANIKSLDKHSSETGGTLLFQVRNTIGQLAEVMTMNRLGRVGIGTSDPKRIIHVSSGVNPGFIFSNTGTGGESMGFLSGTVGSVLDYSDTGYFSIRSNSKANIDSGSTSGSTEVLYLSSGGNVGIGTTTPNQKLQVVGNINASGTVYASAFESHSPIALGIDSDVGYTRLCYKATNGDVVLQSIQLVNGNYQPVYNVDTQGICDKNIIKESYSVIEFSEVNGEIKEIEIKYNTYEKLYSKTQSEEIIKEIRDALEQWQSNMTYNQGDMFQYQGKGYEVIQEHTSQEDWLPNTVPALYKTLVLHQYNEVTAWVQPQGAHDCYPLGAKVTYQGKTYQSTHSCNVWQPPTLWQLIE